MDQLFTVEGFKIDDLSHSGVKGQKWYIRRWQNPDGSLTPAGKEHYYGSKSKSRKSSPSKTKPKTKRTITPEQREKYRRIGKNVLKGTLAAGLTVGGLALAGTAGKVLLGTRLISKFSSQFFDASDAIAKDSREVRMLTRDSGDFDVRDEMRAGQRAV